MNNDNLIEFKTPVTPETFTDALTALVRQGARQIIAQAVEAELAEFLGQYQDLKDDQGRQAVVRNGYLPERTITTGVGEVEIQLPKVRDRTQQGIKFNSSLLPPYLKRSRSVEEVLPWLYLKGISTGDFAEASVPCWGSKPLGCPRVRLVGSKPSGSRSIKNGNSGRCNQSAMSMFGQMVCTSISAMVKTTVNASWY